MSGLEERPLPIPTSLEQIVHRGGIVNLSSIWSSEHLLRQYEQV